MMNSSNPRWRRAAALATAALVSPAFGGPELYVAGTIGEVYMGHPETGGFEYWGGICLAPVHSLGIDDANVFAGDSNGGILRLDLATGQFMELYWVPGDATDIIVHNGDLLVSTSFGDIHRVDPIGGVVESTLSTGIQINAMALHGDNLFLAGPIGVVYKGNAVTGGFELHGATCLGPIGGLTLGGGIIYAGDATGAVLTFDLTTGEFLNVLCVGNSVTGMAMFDGVLLVATEFSDAVLRVNPQTGEVIGTLTATINVDAIEVLLPPGDIDGDGEVGIQDFLFVLGSWGACPPSPDPCPGDLDGNGEVGIGDFLIVIGNWG